MLRSKNYRFGLAALAVSTALIATVFGTVGDARAERISDIANTKHNFSAGSGNTVRATSEDELCVFCHTPHGANATGGGPLWNRELSSATYTAYSSSSMDATGLDQPGGSSKLCLSCHDGTIAIGNVNVLNGSATDGNPATEDIAMQGTNGGFMPAGSHGANTGFTRLLGTDLSNDHPISFTYNDTLASNDGELRSVTASSHIGNRSPGVKPLIPLENGQLQCTACHDPHIRDTVESNIKFLRLNRFQKSAPTGGNFNETNDIICLACHDKDGWAQSAHAHSSVATEQYTSAAASLREFPTGTAVWEAACLNCHDTHTVSGARRLLREGTDSSTTPKQGGNSAIEETCYQCHSDDGAVLTGQGTNGFGVPDIKTDFTTLGNRTMPIDNNPEVHDIGTGGFSQGGADFMESTTLLGNGNRHAECTDCHNPHRVIKERQFNDDASSPATAGTHTHAPTHSNIASGVLRGAWGVEPVYASGSFMANPSSFQVKRGDPGVGATTDVSNTYVTREYQICFKCHSNYAYGSNPPSLGCCTPSGTNSLTKYTNQAMEFQAPTNQKGQPSTNHRSWHPVMEPTGRTKSIRGGSGTMANGMWLEPWDSGVGTQTMYCSDCHGSATANGTAVPNNNGSINSNGSPTSEDGDPWGPHGSSKDFILKGDWSNNTGAGQQDDLCFKCHSYSNYATDNSNRSGFCCDQQANLHGLHAKRIDTGIKCMYCHVAVPHGWKNKAFLVNLNDVGAEAGLSNGTSVGGNRYTKEPYYQDAFNRIVTWRNSGSWTETSCGESGSKNGIGWMKGACEAP